MLLYSSFNNDMNVAVHGEIFPELSGQNFPGKVAEWWEEWYLNPSSKYDYIKRLSKLLPKMLPVSTEQTHVVAQEGMTFTKYASPRYAATESLHSLRSAY